MPEILEVGVDEFTLILRTCRDISFDEWTGEIDNIINVFLYLSHIEELYGPLEAADGKLQAGYTGGLTVTSRPWHFMICWHEFMPKMGVCVRFSAYAYAAYKQDLEQMLQIKLDIATFLKMIASDIYTMRLSRIDLTADYKNYPNPRNPSRYLDPHTLYSGLNEGAYVLKNYQDKKVIRTYSALDKNGAYETFYAGSRRAKTGGFLRCYDKRQEQIATHGFRYNEALNCESWVRFEAVFRGTYAQQITEQLLRISTEDELKQMIAKHISDKYRFFDTDTGDTLKITEDLAGIVADPDMSTLSYPSARDNTLAQSIEHLKTGAGLYSTFFKVWLVWGEDGEKKLLDHLQKEYVNKYKPTAGRKPEIKDWIKKHWVELRGHEIEESFYKTLTGTMGTPYNKRPQTQPLKTANLGGAGKGGGENARNSERGSPGDGDTRL